MPSYYNWPKDYIRAHGTVTMQDLFAQHELKHSSQRASDPYADHYKEIVRMIEQVISIRGNVGTWTYYTSVTKGLTYFLFQREDDALVFNLVK